jgi:hypothetical protein
MNYKTPHNRLIRASLIVAIVAGVATVGLTVTQVKQRIEGLQANLLTQTAARNRAETDLAKSRDELAATAGALNSTRNALDAAIAEKQDALSAAAVQTRRAEKLSKDLAEILQQRDDARDTIARYKVAGLEPEQVVQAARQIKELQTSLAASEETNKALTVRVRHLVSLVPDFIGCIQCEVNLPPGLKAKVLSVDPKWRFLVLDAGETQGVLERGELLVSRHGALVGRARVSRVQGDRCIANLMSGWDLGEVMEGDIAIPAQPER